MLAVVLLAPDGAAAQFTLNGSKLPPAESNFAGVRQVTPRYGIVVQVNHDAHAPRDLELTELDEVYAQVRRELKREPYIRPDALPFVITTGAKIARFGEGGRRRMFRFMEPELTGHKDLHLSPTAIFIAADILQTDDSLRGALNRAVRFLFDEKFRRALDSMDPPIADRHHGR
ncbi:MAG: hypothetical protein ACREKB_02590 [Candidatus Rokuibacteriota bacterium]